MRTAVVALAFFVAGPAAASSFGQPTCKEIAQGRAEASAISEVQVTSVRGVPLGEGADPADYRIEMIAVVRHRIKGGPAIGTPVRILIDGNETLEGLLGAAGPQRPGEGEMGALYFSADPSEAPGIVPLERFRAETSRCSTGSGRR
jgi:hypothetical protein